MSVAYDMSGDDGFKPIGLGHNSGRNLREMLQEQYREPLKRAEDLLAAADRVPAVIADDDENGRVGDFIKQLLTAIKNLEASRVAEKDPFLAAGREVDGVFNTIKDRLEKAKAAVLKRQTAYLNEKAERERKAREAEERRRAEEARRAEEERRRAEQARIEAEQRARRAEEEARQAKLRAEQEARDREERHRRELAAAEARAREEETKRRQSEASREKAQAEAERLRREAAEKAERERVAAEAEAKRAAEDAERRAAEARAEQQRLADEAVSRQRAADEAEARRIEAEKLALAKPADMARSRSDLGSVSTLKRKWVFSVSDPRAIDWNELGPYISADARDKAINAAIRNGVRPGADGIQPLKGIHIYETNDAVVR